MISLPVKVRNRTSQTINMQIDRNAFERLADLFGYFRPEFLQSIDRAEVDIKKGRVKKLRSLKDLRKM